MGGKESKQLSSNKGTFDFSITELAWLHIVPVLPTLKFNWVKVV